MTRGTPFQAGQSGNPGGKPKSAELSALARRYTVDALRGLVAVARLEASKHDSAVTAACRALLDIGYPGHLKAAGADGEAANVLHLHLLAVAGAPVGATIHQNGPLAPPGSALAQAQLAQLPPEPPDRQFEGPTEEEYLAQLAEDGMLPPASGALPHEALPLWDRSTHGFGKTGAAIAGNTVEFGQGTGVDLNRAIQQGAPADYRAPVIGFGE